MTDHVYPPEWSTEPPHPQDPVLGEEMQPWRPTAKQRADAIKQAMAYCAGEHQFGTEFLEFCADRYADRAWPQAFLALLELLRTTAVGSQGQELTVARLVGDLDHAHDDRLMWGN